MTIFTCVEAQNNVGVGTRNPDFSAIAEFADSNRGFLVPRTDTQSVINYVNSLVPNPGIAHGLTIFEVNERIFYIYNGLKQKWEPINSVSGPRGPTGPTGPKGDRGDLGRSTQWRDSSFVAPFKRAFRESDTPRYQPPYNFMLGDTCGDIYHDRGTGLIWAYDCDSSKWIGPVGRWRSLGPGFAESLQCLTLIVDSMSQPGDTNLKYLEGLRTIIRVPPDTVAYIKIVAEGAVKKTSVNDTATNHMYFNIRYTDENSNIQFLNSGQIVAVNRNSPPIPPSTVGLFDKVPWTIGTTKTLKGKLSTQGNPLPPNDYNIFRFDIFYDQLYTPGNPFGADGQVTISDARTPGIYESFAVMNVFVMFERSPDALKP